MLAIDQDAVTIGQLYRTAQSATSDRVLYLSDASHRLLRKKESLGYGSWLEWLSANQGVLGFGEGRARILINAAEWIASNWQLANTVEDIVTDPNASAEDLARAEEIKRLISSQFRPAVRGTFGRRKNEWHTPPEYIAIARSVLGHIDTDPASNERAQELIKAGTYFDKQNSGLCQPWYGRVWLNPPYSRPLISKFIGKMLMEWDSGRVAECIMLTHNYTDTAWFHDAAAVADAICFTQGRVKFYEPDGEIASPTQGQTFFYYGPKVDAFKHEFGRVGLIVRPEPDSWSRRRVRDAVQNQI